MEAYTKTKILTEALRLFSEKGYSATSVQEIATAVGIKAPSLYNHFESKQKIFDAIVDMVREHFAAASDKNNIPEGSLAQQVEQYSDGGIKLLKTSAHRLFHYYLTDTLASRFRKMLAIEKYKNPEADRAFTQIYVDAPIGYQAAIFAEMIRQGYMVEADPEIMAYHFFSPVAVLLDKCSAAPEKEEEAYGVLDRHIEQFNQIYKRV